MFNFEVIAAARYTPIGSNTNRLSRSNPLHRAMQAINPPMKSTISDTGVLIRKATGKKYHQPVLLNWPAR